MNTCCIVGNKGMHYCTLVCYLLPFEVRKSADCLFVCFSSIRNSEMHNYCEYSCSTAGDRLVGLVVKPSISRAENPGFESRLRRDFSSRVIPVTTLTGAWRYRVSAGTGWPGVSIL